MPGEGTSTRTKKSSAATRSKKDNGEEEIVIDMMDLDDDTHDDAPKKKSVLDGPSKSSYDENQYQNMEKESDAVEYDSVSNTYMYDSDSSIEEDRNKKKQDGSLKPIQLPFPSAPHQQTMYDCQEVTDGEEKKSDFGVAASSTSMSSKLSDPPLQSPFLDLESVSDELKQIESENWFLMKLPTRLPQVGVSSSSAAIASNKKKVTAIKKELNEESASSRPDTVGSSNFDTSTGGDGVSATNASSDQQRGYDDTLKDTSAGRYGRIVVHRSGKTELVIGGDENGPEVRLLIHEGLQCGFRQEAVSIDHDNEAFVSLGGVKKSLVVTPNIDIS